MSIFTAITLSIYTNKDIHKKFFLPNPMPIIPNVGDYITVEGNYSYPIENIRVISRQIKNTTDGKWYLTLEGSIR